MLLTQTIVLAFLLAIPAISFALFSILHWLPFAGGCAVSAADADAPHTFATIFDYFRDAAVGDYDFDGGHSR